MATSTKLVNMQVPENMVQHLHELMERMQVQNNHAEKEDNNPEVEVVRVVNHRITECGKWQFQVVWKGYRTREWVNDEDCNCDKMISLYLADKCIHTAYLFCRVSTKEQATSVNVSLEAQEAELRSSLPTDGEYTRVKVYSIAQSAYRNIPQTLQRIGNAALPGDIIMVWRVDRLSRNIIKYLSWLEDLDSRSVVIYSRQENITYSGKKLEFIQALLDAQKEAELLGTRVKLANRRKKERGDEGVGRLPYGKKYKRMLNNDNSTSHKIIIDVLYEQDIITRIRLSKKTATEIADELNAEGITKRGRVWNKGIVRRMKSHRQ